MSRFTVASDKKKELADLLRRVEERAPVLENIGRKIIEGARFSRDIASCARDTIDSLPGGDVLPPEEWNHIIASWKDWHKAADGAGDAQTFANTVSATASGVGLTTSHIFYTYTLKDPPSQAIIATKAEIFCHIVNQNVSGSEIKASMERLGLNMRGGTNRNPVDLFEDAKSALQRPSLGEGSPVAILIALRGCIESVLGELLRRRPIQEPTGKIQDKILSIGRHCGHPGLGPDHFKRLGVDAHALLDELSGGKQAAIPRDGLIRRFQRGELFLKALLDSIDETKLRP